MISLSRFLFTLSSYCRYRIINGPNQTPYLERYHLCKLPFGWHINLHRFVASDPGRGLHNHPWNKAFSILLCGQYEEVRMNDSSKGNTLRKRRMRSGRMNWINGQVFHRVNLIDDGECWTIFLHGPKTRSWGFLKKESHQYAFHDHDMVLKQNANPQWWKTANRPIDQPSMRKPIHSSPNNCIIV